MERAEGRKLIDVDGNRYFDAISSLWVTTLGHRVPELDAAVIDQLGKVAHATLLGNGSRATVEFAEALAAVVPVVDPHVLFASDGAVAVEQALKVAFQYWVNRGEPGHTQFLALGDAYHGDTVGALSLGDGGFGTALFDPLRFPVVRTPGYAAADWAAKMVACIEAHADSLAAVVIEPLVQGASGMLVAEPVGPGPGGRGLSDPRACCSSATRWPPASGGPEGCSPRSGPGPDSARTSCAWARASPVGTCPCRPRWPRGRSSRRSTAPTSASRPSTTATPTAGTPWPAPWPSGTSS